MQEPVTSQTQIVLYTHANGTGRLFGGQLIAWMDVTGAVAARRKAGREVVTAAVEALCFLTPAQVNDVVVVEARVVSVGRTSMRVEVAAYVERLGGAREATCQSVFTFVAIDEQGKPTPVAILAPDKKPSK